MKKSVVIEVDIDRALDFLEEQFPNPEKRWGELRGLIAKQKAAQEKDNSSRCPDCGNVYYHAPDCSRR